MPVKATAYATVPHSDDEAAAAQGARSRLSAFFGIKLDTKVVVVADERKLQRCLGLKSIPWFAMGGVQGNTVYVISRKNALDRKLNPEEIPGVIRHEMSHIFLQSLNKKVPLWLAEGIGEFFGFENKQPTPLRRWVTLHDLTTPQQWEAAGYPFAQARLFVRFLIEKFGEKKVCSLLREYANERSFEKVLGAGINSLEEEFRKRLEHA